MDTNTKLKFPKFNWDRILKTFAILLGGSFLAAMIIRGRTIIRIVQVLDVAVVLALLLLIFIAIVKRYSK